MIELKIHSDIDASCLAVQNGIGKTLLDKLKHNEMAGWLELPKKYKKTEIQEILETAKRIQEDSEFLVCVGVGGSYLGHRAVIEVLGNKSETKVLYAGNSLSSLEFERLASEIGEADFSVLVISKSGETMEPAVGFRLLKNKLFEKYGENRAFERIYVTTDQRFGTLHDEALYNHYKRFVIPDDIGGRYSVLTTVGLLPMAVAGIDIEALLLGAREESAALETDLSQNILQYASIRHLLRHKNYQVEALASFEPAMRYFLEWWKQLFGESEGKEDQGILPISLVYTADLHSMGQYMQQGQKNIFETIISFADAGVKVEVPELSDDRDGLGYLVGRDLEYINEQAKQATIEAHKVRMPVLELRLPDLSERSMGNLIYFFETACALSAMMQGVNPFDQPGVENYKNEMQELLNVR